MANVFQTSSFVVRDTSTLVFNSVTGAPVDTWHPKHVCVDDLLPLNKIMVFTVLEVSRQAILLSVVVVSAHRFNNSPESTTVSTSYMSSSIRELVKLDGKVVEGMDVVRKMETVRSEDGDTSKPVVIKDCGMAK
ncbi:hypothetical protein EMCRGX_G008304 [Ephydatia muelleri]